MLEYIGTILGIIGSIVTIIVGIIGFYGVFKKDSFSNIDVIEYGLSDLDKQNSMRHSAIIRSTFNVIIIMSIVGVLPFAILVDDSESIFVFILMVLSLIVCVEVLFFLSLILEKKVEYIQWIGSSICAVIIVGLIYVVSKEFEWLDFFTKIMWGIGLILMLLWFAFFKRKVKQSLFARFRCRLIFVFFVYVESLLEVFYLSLSKQRIFLEKFISSKILSSIEEYIPNKLLWMLLLTIIFIFIVLWINSMYYKMMEKIAFLYCEQGSEKRYIYRKIGNQFLCGNKDYLKCDEKEFFAEIEKVRKAIRKQRKKKKWKEEFRHELEKEIDRLKPYSGYIKIEEAKEEFNKLNTCIDKYDDKEKRDNTTSEEKKEGNSNSADNSHKEGNKDDNRNLALEALKDDVKQHVNEIIETFEEKKTAVKLLPEDELKNYTIYPIIDEERSGFFN